MSESRPLLEGDGGNLQAVNLNGFPRIGQKLRGTRRHGVQNDKETYKILHTITMRK